MSPEKKTNAFPGGRRLRRLMLLAVSAVAMVLGMAVLTWQDYAATLVAAEQEEAAEARLLEEYVLRTLSAVDGILLQVCDLIDEAGLDGLRTEAGWRRLVSLAQAHADPAGRVDAVVQVGVSVEYIAALIQAGRRESVSSAGLYRVTEGRVVVRYPFNDGMLDESITGAPFFSPLASGEQTEWSGRYEKNGERLFVAARRLADLPLIVTAAGTEADIFAGFRKRLGWRVPVLLCIMALMGGWALTAWRYEAVMDRRVSERTTELQASEARFRVLFDGSPLGLLVADLQTQQILFGNAAFERMTGYPQKELSEIRVQDLHPKEAIPLAVETFIRMSAGERKHCTDLPVRRRDGSLFPANIQSAELVIGERRCILGTFMDNTAQKEAEERLRNSEFKYRIVADNTFDWEFWIGTDGKYLYTSPSCERITGHKPAEFEADPGLMKRIVHPDDLPGFLAHRGPAMAESRERELEFRIIRPDGEVRWIGHVCGHIRDSGGGFMGVRGSNRDITERVQAELAMKKSWELYRALVENLPVAVIFMDTSLKIVMANRAAAELSNFAGSEDLIGHSAMEFTAPGESSRLMGRYAELKLSGTLPPSERQFVRADGSMVPIKATGVALTDGNGNGFGFLGIAEDISGQVRTRLEAEALKDVWRIFFETDSPDTIYQRLAETLAARLGFPFAAVELYDADRQEMVFVGVSGLADISAGVRMPVHQLLSGTVAKTGEPACEDRIGIRNVADHYGVLQKLGVETFICVPFREEDRVVGTLAVADRIFRDDAKEWVQNLEVIARTLSLEMGRRKAVEALHSSETRYRTLVDNLPIAVTLADLSGRVVAANPTAASFQQFERCEDLQGMKLFDFIVPRERERVMRIFGETMSRGEVDPFESGLLRRDGSTLSAELSGVVLKDAHDRPTGFIAIAQDITARKRLEWELRRLNRDLERRVRERTTQLLRARDAAEAASRAKSIFVANMSHELRTPLNAVIGFSDALDQEIFGPLNPKQKEYIGDIRESGQHLLYLINDILDLSKIEAGKLEPEWSRVNVQELLESSLTLIREKCRSCGIQLELSISDDITGLEIAADRRRLKQILYNLLSNAVKFTPGGGRIIVSGRRTASAATEESGCNLEISVSDTGIGIEDGDLGRIFDEFVQVRQNRTDKTPGTGLGLTLVRQLVALHGGRVRAESKGPDHGARFVMEIPLDARAPASGRVPEAEGGDG